jgi:hypothetical protein
MESLAEQKSREQFYWDLWWLAEEILNTADAIGPVPDLAERSLRAHVEHLREIIAPLNAEVESTDAIAHRPPRG